MKKMCKDGSTVLLLKCHLGRNEHTASRAILIAAVFQRHMVIFDGHYEETALI
jgi:hypothetical protein